MNFKDLEELNKLKSEMDPLMADAIIGDLAPPYSMEMESPGFSFERELEANVDKTTLCQELTGLTEDEIKKLQNSGKHLVDFIPASERSTLSKGWTGRAFKKVENEFLHAGGNITQAMTETFDLFQEKFTASEQNLIQKAIKALDVSCFLQLIAKGMQRA